MVNLLSEGGKQLLLGNEAITRGLIEAGVGFASTYPGTPSSEIGNILEKISSDTGMYFEFSTNEKVAVVQDNLLFRRYVILLFILQNCVVVIILQFNPINFITQSVSKFLRKRR